MIRLILLSAAALALFAQAPPPPPKPAAPRAASALDKKTLETFLRHLLLYPPHVNVAVSDPQPSEVPGLLQVAVRASAGNASEQRLFLISRDGSKVIEAKVYDVARNPFQKEIEQLKTAGAPALGAPGAPVVVVLFSDFECTYCAQEAKSLRADLAKTFPTQVRLYFKDMPIEQIHPWARAAALAGRCVFNQNAEAFWEYHDWAFQKQNEIKPENFSQLFSAWAKQKGLDTAKLDSCRLDAATGAVINQSIAEAHSLGVNSTPTLFINGRKIAGYVPWENLKQILELEIGYQATANNAGEQCCSLPPLSPAKAQ